MRIRCRFGPDLPNRLWPLTLQNGVFVVWDLLRNIAQRATLTDSQVYLVGGALRDMLMGLAPGDLDLAVSANALSLAKIIAKEHQGTLVILDENRETIRVIFKDQCQVDFSLFKGSTIEEDLWARDFTINALALKLTPWLDQEWDKNLIDPAMGRQDLSLGLLRVTNSLSILDDPIRVLRGVRLAARYKLTILPETTVYMKQGARRIDVIAGERIWQELYGILDLEDTSRWIDFMDRELKLWHYLLPGRLRMEETKQNCYHVENVWRHSLRTFHCLEVILKELPTAQMKEQSIAKNLLKDLAGDGTRLPILKLAALLHDVGKPDTALTHDSGRISFHGHPEAGVPYAEAIADKLKLSKIERQYLVSLVLYHMRPLHLYTSRRYSSLSLYRFFRTLRDYALDTLILSLADLTATYYAGERLSELTAYHQFIFNVIARCYEQATFKPVKYLSGLDMIKLGVPEGPLVGQFLEKLAEAQITGEVQDLNSARQWVKNRLLCTSLKSN